MPDDYSAGFEIVDDGEDDDGCWERYDGEDELDDWNIDDYDDDGCYDFEPYPDFPPDPWPVQLYWWVRHALTRLVSSIKWRFRHA
jgi:hypothetical protein